MEKLPMETFSAPFISLSSYKDNAETKLPKTAASRYILKTLGLPVPNTIIITSAALIQFTNHDNLLSKINHFINNCSLEDPDQIETAVNQIQKLIQSQPFPEELFNHLSKFISAHLGNQVLTLAKNPFSPAATADFQVLSGDTALAMAIRQAWSQMVSRDSVIKYHQSGNLFQTFSDLIVTAFPTAQFTGELSTSHPILENKELMEIAFLQGSLASYNRQAPLPSRLIINRQTGTIQSYHPINQNIIFNIDRRFHIQTSKLKSTVVTSPFSPKIIQQLVQAANKIQHYYGSPQTVIFQIINNDLIFWSAESLEPTTRSQNFVPSVFKPVNYKPLAQGIPASPGIVSGPFTPLKSASEINRISSGDIVYLSEFKSAYLPIFKKAGALIVQKGSPLSHLAIISRELGLPCIVNCQFPHLPLTGQVVTIDAIQGLVYTGGLTSETSPIKYIHKPFISPGKPATKVISILPVKPNPVFDASVSGYYLNGDAIFTAAVNSPETLLKESLNHLYNEAGDRTIFYQLSDSNLKAESIFSRQGLSGYLDHDSNLKLQLKFIQSLLDQHTTRNFNLVIPFSRFLDEFTSTKKLLVSLGYQRSNSKHLYLSVDTPALLLDLDRYIKIGIDGLILNYNHLLPLIFGLDSNDPAIISRLYSPQSSLLVLTQYALGLNKAFDLPIYVTGFVIDRGLYLEDLVSLGITGLITPSANVPHLNSSLMLIENRFISNRSIKN